MSSEYEYSALRVAIPELEEFHAGEVEAGLREKTVKRMVLRQKLLRAAARGVSARQAAMLFGVSNALALEYFRNPQFRRDVQQFRQAAISSGDASFVQEEESLQSKLQRISHSAFDFLCEVLQDPEEDRRLRVKVAESFLNRVPEAAQQQHNTTDYRFSVNDLMQAATVADEMHKHNVIPFRREGVDEPEERTA